MVLLCDAALAVRRRARLRLERHAAIGNRYLLSRANNIKEDAVFFRAHEALLMANLPRRERNNAANKGNVR